MNKKHKRRSRRTNGGGPKKLMGRVSRERLTRAQLDVWREEDARIVRPKVEESDRRRTIGATIISLFAGIPIARTADPEEDN